MLQIILCIVTILCWRDLVRLGYKNITLTSGLKKNKTKIFYLGFYCTNEYRTAENFIEYEEINERPSSLQYERKRNTFRLELQLKEENQIKSIVK